MKYRPRWAGRTLRGRLTVGLVAVLLAACAVTGVTTTLLLQGFLVSRLDAQLTSAGGRFSASLEHGQIVPGGSDGDSDNAVPGQSVGTLGVRIENNLVTNAVVVNPDGRSRKVTFSAADIASLRAIPAGGRPRSAHLDGLGEYRLEAVAGRDGDIQITGLPTHEIDEIVGRLTAIEVTLFAVVVTISGLITAFGVSRTLSPLRRVADTALHVSELPLTEAATQLPGVIAPRDPTTEVDHVSVAFDHMLDHIRNALRARDDTEAGLRQFVADASHELRTPLATIRAYSEYASRSGDQLLEVAPAAFARIDAAAARMATLVDDLLLLARLDAGRPLASDRVDLTQLVVEAVDDVRTAVRDHRWLLDLPDEPIVVTGDAQRLHQVLVNLLGNAGAHTPAGTIVTTILSVRGDRTYLDVCDDGPGIAPELQAGLFNRFTRGDSARTGHGSTGLGLAIAHGMAAAHGGTLEVASRPGQTCFSLNLPRPTNIS